MRLKLIYLKLKKIGNLTLQAKLRQLKNCVNGEIESSAIFGRKKGTIKQQKQK